MKESVKAAAMDAKSQKLLALQLHNTVHATKAQTKATEDYLGKLSMQVGIVDDNLRPALANAVRGTGSLAKGQKLLSLALDASAATGKPLNTVMNALIKAQNGQLTGLYKLAPELKKNKGNLDDFAKSVKGAAMANADPFSRLNVAMDNLKEQFGRLLLPAVIQFTNYVTEKVVPAVSAFLDQVANPKTDVGKTFLQIKDAVKKSFDDVKNFFALFGQGDAIKGFGNIAKSLIQMLPALALFKSIMILAKAGKGIANIVAAVAALRGGSGGSTPTVVGGKTGKGPMALPFGAVAAEAGLVLSLGGDTQQGKVAPRNAKTFTNVLGGKKSEGITVVVNSYGKTPAEFGSLVADAIARHNRLNGKK
jgi:hypothetical protein